MCSTSSGGKVNDNITLVYCSLNERLLEEWILLPCTTPKPLAIHKLGTCGCCVVDNVVFRYVNALLAEHRKWRTEGKSRVWCSSKKQHLDNIGGQSVLLCWGKVKTVSSKLGFKHRELMLLAPSLNLMETLAIVIGMKNDKSAMALTNFASDVKNYSKKFMWFDVTRRHLKWWNWYTGHM